MLASQMNVLSYLNRKACSLHKWMCLATSTGRQIIEACGVPEKALIDQTVLNLRVVHSFSLVNVLSLIHPLNCLQHRELREPAITLLYRERSSQPPFLLHI